MDKQPIEELKPPLRTCQRCGEKYEQRYVANQHHALGWCQDCVKETGS